MKHRLLRLVSPFVLLATLSTVAFAQSGSTLTGVVADSSGALIPGADVVAKNNATGASYSAVSSDKGTFTIPAMAVGTYTVTVSLMGFKTFQLPDVPVSTNGPTSVKATLEVGNLSETVVVKGGSEIVQTQSTTIATTLNATQITKLPLVSRDAMNFLTFLPGVDTSGTPRSSTISGLPTGMINITIDGVNTQDNNNRTTDGFFSLISPRLDAVEEVTVQTAAQGADSAGQGAVQIKFTTRSGTNKYSGSGYYYLRDPKFNSNYWFNNRDKAPDPATGKAPKDQVKLYQPGFRLGGPIQIPGLYDGHDKAFFFVNYEQFRQPNPVTRTRLVMSDTARSGVFRYGTGGVNSVNVLSVAAANGQLATQDPVVQKLLADIAASTAQGTVTARTDPNTADFVYTADSKQLRHYPTWRIDYNLTNNHRISYTTWYQKYSSSPDTLNNAEARFPGFPVAGGQTSDRWNFTGSMRSTLGKNLVNQFVTGYTKSTVNFFTEVTPDSFKNQSIGDQGGFALGINAFAGITTPTSTTAPQARNNPTIDVNDTLTWLKGNHSFTFGGTFTHVGLWAFNQTPVPTISFGLATGDPAAAMFNTTNFPGASSTDLTNAQNLYAVLTGRVSQIAANARLGDDGKYTYLGPAIQRGQLHEYGFFVQDSWRWKKNLTLNYGLRYELQQPFVSRNNSYSTATVADVWGVSGVGNLFKPGTLTGKKPEYQNLTANTQPYKTDYNNLAPSLGLTWRPSSEQGLLRKILGQEGDTVLSAAYSLAYNRGGMADFTGIFGSNPGLTITTNRTQGLGNLVMDGGTLPLLLRDTARLGAPSFPSGPTYPNFGLVTDEIDTFEPNLQVPYAQSWTAGWQRAINRNTAVTVRYVGTRSLQGFVDYNFNEVNIVENGFLNEFKNAQKNLQANIAAGRGNTFAYTGAPGTSPLPIFLGAYNGQPASAASNTAAYTGTNWTNTTHLGLLALQNPKPGGAIDGGTGNTAGFASLNTTFGLIGNATFRNNLIAAGYPSNLFIANPDKIGGAFVRGNGGYTRYDSLQIEARRRLTHGLLIEGNYVLGKQTDSSRYSFRTPREGTLDNGPRHAFKMNWVYELPFGRGRAFGNGVNTWIDRIIGGWEFDGAGRVQSGQILSFGNVRLVGMTEKELQKVYKLRFDDAGKIIYILPQDIIDNTINAFSVSATSPTGYGSRGAPTGRYFAPANGPDCIQVVNGDCAPHNIYVTGPKFVRFDLSFVKRVALVGRSNFEFRTELLNAFNNVNFTPVAQTGTSLTQNQVTAGYRDVNGTQDPGGRLVQFVFRVTF
ncbi:MAG TPA: TonB-dependent receptor [Vicinamibacterales bacterium]